jgi:UDP-N-acetylmuramate: L-alanyl-gamma-D-glutamyl-meso-diaminopimelate ligase
MGEPQTVHLLGICGSGMSALACLLSEKGYVVTGSDANPYPPATTLLAERDIRVFRGYSPQNLEHDPDIVVVGNVIKRDNLEARAVDAQGYNPVHMPRALSEMVLENRDPIVVAGTHGKTSTSSLLAWILDRAGLDPGFLIGGVPLNFGKNYRLGGGRLFVVEGDEYDCAYFDKVPKFIYYRPLLGIVGNVEFEHADIYPSMESVRNAFGQFVSLIPEEGFLAAGVDDPEVRDLLDLAVCRVEGFGTSADSEWHVEDANTGAQGLRVLLREPGGETRALTTQLWGSHHAQNLAAAAAIARHVGVSWEAITEATSSFCGVKRRLEVLGEACGVTVVDDYAHHPTEVDATVKAARARFPGRRLWAVLEPRTQTARRHYFQQEFAAALMLADRAVVAPAYGGDELAPDGKLDVEELVSTVASHGTEAVYLRDAEAIARHIVEESRRADVVLIMSPGSFGGVHTLVLEMLAKR